MQIPNVVAKLTLDLPLASLQSLLEYSTIHSQCIVIMTLQLFPLLFTGLC
jgi:hypothetical protein